MAVTAKQKKNLRPPLNSQTAKESGRRGGIKSGEVRRQKKKQREILRNLLNLKLKDLPLDSESVESLCYELGLKPTTLVSEAHCVMTLYQALHGKPQYSRLLYEVDGSMDPDPLETEDPKTLYMTLLPARESYAKKAVERVKGHFTSEEWENVRVFFNSLVEAREAKETLEKMEENGIPDIDQGDNDIDRLL